MSNSVIAVENFINSRDEKNRYTRELFRSTSELQVCLIEDYRVVPICSINEYRLIVALAGALMLDFAYEQVAAKGGSISLGAGFAEYPDLRALLLEGEAPQLIELSISRSSLDWPRAVYNLPGYSAGIEGFRRLGRVNWDAVSSLDLTAHGISSVYPRTRNAIKNLKSKGLSIRHEKLVTGFFDRITKASQLFFLRPL